MSHSVQAHLDVAPAAYDVAIRKFIPHYEEMLSRAVETLAGLVSPKAHILDLGAGTGAFSQEVAARMPEASLTLLDADPAMLEQARGRLASLGGRAKFLRGSFFDPLPACEAAIASLALHHVHDLSEKRRLYGNIRATLPTGGVLVNVDITLATAPALEKLTRTGWAAHLVACGDTEAEAYARFDAWAQEDRYFSVTEELDALQSAGFAHIDVLWRRGPGTVLLAVA
ncbi:class I SAM-dependent methyltransferase [Hyalangium rubrum]|uniref:Class I SAM-dependent methyltransferase n=1 Tax=Hyalangium rubrum TaxID=3103134 RepID=A0ABU5HEB0_9BACT|nr:class I SAM-dependent methyltransferase [Hyalangium sp. s54d21]MDY7231132.1 class I SAM-dependent methyltransferase [Hyalangium sp. s54d21]